MYKDEQTAEKEGGVKPVSFGSLNPVRDLYCSKRVLAPLVGGSDLSFRLLARLYGAQLTCVPIQFVIDCGRFTEMCIAEHYVNRNNPKAPTKVKQ